MLLIDFIYSNSILGIGCEKGLGVSSRITIGRYINLKVTSANGKQTQKSVSPPPLPKPFLRPCYIARGTFQIIHPKNLENVSGVND